MPFPAWAAAGLLAAANRQLMSSMCPAKHLRAGGATSGWAVAAAAPTHFCSLLRTEGAGFSSSVDCWDVGSASLPGLKPTRAGGCDIATWASNSCATRPAALNDSRGPSLGNLLQRATRLPTGGGVVAESFLAIRMGPYTCRCVLEGP